MKSSVLLALAMASPAIICGQDAATVDALKQELRELRQRTEQLEEKLKRFETAPAATPPVSTNAVAAPAGDGIASLPPPKWSPAAPMTLYRGQNSYMNMSLDGLFAVGGSTAKDIETLQ